MDTRAVDGADLRRRARRSLNELVLDIIAARHVQRGGDVLIAGVDIIEISRVKRVYELYGERFLRRIYTSREIVYCRGRAPQLASRFAAKEATMKALGTGVRGIRWRDIEILRGRGQAPRIELHGTAKSRAERLGLSQITLSLSHSKDFAVASVVGDSKHGNILHRNLGN